MKDAIFNVAQVALSLNPLARRVMMSQLAARHSDFDRCATVPEFHRASPIGLLPTTGSNCKHYDKSILLL